MDLLGMIFGKPLPSVRAAELDKKLRSGKRPLVLDVRQKDEYRSGHIAGAKLIPLNELGARLKELPQSREIVCVCASGNRSSSATRMLTRASYNAINMKGGMSAWRREGLAVKKGDS